MNHIPRFNDECAVVFPIKSYTSNEELRDYLRLRKNTYIPNKIRTIDIYDETESSLLVRYIRNEISPDQIKTYLESDGLIAVGPSVQI